MKKFTCIIATLLLTVQFTFSQEKYSRIKISNPNQQQINTIAIQGIELSCGVKHEGEDLILELNETELSNLETANVSYTLLIDDVSDFYSNRAQNTTHIRSVSSRSTLSNTDSNMSRSISSVVHDNIIQYYGSNDTT